MKNLAIHRPGALGDIMCIIMLQDTIYEVYGIFDLFVHESYYSAIVPLLKYNKNKFNFYPVSELNRNNYNKVVDLVGYPVHLGYPKVSMKKHLMLYMLDELGIAYEALPEQLMLEAPPPPAKLLKTKNYITVQLKTGWSRYKEFKAEQLDSMCLAVKTWYASDIIQIGAENEPKLNNADVHMLGYSLEEAIGAQAWAKYHIGPDSFFNHTTNLKWTHKGNSTKGLIYFGSTSPIGSGYDQNINIYAGAHCQPCYRENPEISSAHGGPCPFNHMCLSRMPVEFLQSYIIKLFE